ncbi:MAG: hypothetical protein ACR2PO_05750 [Methyloligellaceae bacterium]
MALATGAPIRGSDDSAQTSASDAAADGGHRIGAQTAGHAQAAFANLDAAAANTIRATKLEQRCDDMERSLQLVASCLNAADAIESILSDTKDLFDRGRKSLDTNGRRALALAFNELRLQIDLIAADAEYDGENLALGATVEVAINEKSSRLYRLPTIDLSAIGLGIQPATTEFSTDPQVAMAVAQLDVAMNDIQSHKTVLEIAASVLSSRKSFSNRLIASLKQSTHALTAQEMNQAVVDELVARATIDMTPGTLSPDHLLNSNDNIATAIASVSADFLKQDDPIGQKGDDADDTLANGSKEDIIAFLDSLSPELARTLDPDTYMSYWLKYDKGETKIFTRRLVELFQTSETQILANKKYLEDSEFRNIADDYNKKFETIVLLEKNKKGGCEQKEIEELLSTENGIVYIMTAKAAGRLK